MLLIGSSQPTSLWLLNNIILEIVEILPVFVRASFLAAAIRQSPLFIAIFCHLATLISRGNMKITLFTIFCHLATLTSRGNMKIALTNSTHLLQRCSKRSFLGCVKRALAARGSQDSGITQPSPGISRNLSAAPQKSAFFIIRKNHCKIPYLSQYFAIWQPWLVWKITLFCLHQ